MQTQATQEVNAGQNEPGNDSKKQKTKEEDKDDNVNNLTLQKWLDVTSEDENPEELMTNLLHQYITHDRTNPEVAQESLKQALAVGKQQGWTTDNPVEPQIPKLLKPKGEVTLPKLSEKGSEIECRYMQFSNWATTVTNGPVYVFYPKTIEGVKAIVKWAAANNIHVRASGYRHSFGPVFANNTQSAIISVLPEKNAGVLPHEKLIVDQSTLPEDSLLKIQFDATTRRVTVGAAVTNYMMREWCKKNDVTLPLNVIMEEITLGGSNAPICHGAGKGNKTLSDLVTKITWINNAGEEQTIDEKDPHLLHAAAGALGLLGIVVKLTIQLDPMTYAVLNPKTVVATEAVPPPKGWVVPKRWSQPSDKQIDISSQAFDELVNKSYYCEFFWFPYSKYSWVNCWKNNGRKEDVVHEYPPAWLDEFQQQSSTLCENITKVVGGLNSFFQAKMFGNLILTVLSSISKEVTVHLCDGLHFQHGIQNMRVWNFELEIPLKSKPDGSPDLDPARCAWWQAIDLVERRWKEAPIRIALEMRIMGGSDIHLAPQKGNDFTCAIEILTSVITDRKVWTNFIQELLDAWSDIPNSRVHPHWAKEWAPTTLDKDFKGWTIQNKPIVEYIKKEYSAELNAFKDAEKKLAEKAGIKVENNAMFSNDTLDEVFK